MGRRRRRPRGGASTHGEILGVAASSAAGGINAWPDRPEPLARTMRLALEDAGLGPDAVDVVYAAANATRGLDAIEAVALTGLFGGARTVVTSIKGALGEFGASGGAACVAALLCGRLGRVPPIAGLECADPAAASLRLARTAVDAPGPIVLVNGFASGGALVQRRAPRVTTFERVVQMRPRRHEVPRRSRRRQSLCSYCASVPFRGPDGLRFLPVLVFVSSCLSCVPVAFVAVVYDAAP